MREGAGIERAFVARYERAADAIARAPGRVNLIGEHTDYNAGWVLPMGLEQCVRVAGATRRDGILRVWSDAMGADEAWAAEEWDGARRPSWTSYIAGAARLLGRQGIVVPGADLLVESDLPAGGGLSSSAALSVATVLVLARLAGARVPRSELAALARNVEHEFAGVRCGVMDPLASVFARREHALLIDCRSLQTTAVRLPLTDHRVVVIDSGVRHALAASAYGERQAECMRAVEVLRARDPGVTALRDVGLEALVGARGALGERIFRRARHVVSENERTCAAADALGAGDLVAFGRLMNVSHDSLRDDFEVSCDEVDRLVAVVRGCEGVLGARMTGGGFGGCVVALVRKNAVAALANAVASEYIVTNETRASVRACRAGDGATLIS